MDSSRKEDIVTPGNQAESATRKGLKAGECKCGWMVLNTESRCGKCGQPLDWSK